MPKTGGISSVLAVIFGGILATGGKLLGRKNK
ncbi:MAG: LPXTG cell wall anchor domain-containing protein [Clostridium celatum]|nr:LPXTG cell wall anchor domain-containing protein [Clostridium celatum]MDU2124091.1 LPXTG cell wall anchor domain-containing protein [Clostridium celatum]MDU2490573.1 LPXTG cell wall anchor domain-containing protein [Clostridium celatum]MDU4980877.1 LPXTG cell wall anchor domain-containing protein [Clostridium celatum]